MTSDTKPRPPAGKLSVRPAPGVPGVERLARQLMGKALDQFVYGELVVIDTDGSSRTFGVPGTGPRVEMHVLDPRLYGRLLRNAEIGLGEGYVAREWATDDLVTLLQVLVRNYGALRAGKRRSLLSRTRTLASRLPDRQHRARARNNIAFHYDLGNDFFVDMLGPTMGYSCGIFEGEATTLDEAQVAKFDRVCRKLDLTSADHLLEIGCGWGGFALHAASTYGARVTGVTISQEQHAFATAAAHDAGLSELVEFRLLDYRDLVGTYTKIASIEMIEAIGWQEYDTYFCRIDELLAPGGIACVQAILTPEVRYDAHRLGTDWTREYVFPGSVLPSLSALAAAMARASTLELLDVEEIGVQYARTLREWRQRWVASREKHRANGFDGVFDRTWEYYLTAMEVNFGERWLRDVQLVYARPMTGCSRGRK